MPAPRIDRLTLLLAAVSLLGAGIVLAREATWGPFLNIQSITYVVVAQSLLAEQTFTAFPDVSSPEGAYVYWPPLWPLLLAGTGLSLLDPLAVVGPLNAAIFALTVFAAGCWLRSRVRSRFLVVWGWLALALSVPLIDRASTGHADSVFALLAALSLMRMDAFLREGKRPALTQAAVLTAFACLTRYAGGALLLTLLLLLLFQRGAAPLERARRAAAAGLIGGAPAALWMLRNLLLDGSPAGQRSFAPLSFAEALDQTLTALAAWFVPDARALEFRTLTAPLAAAALLLLLAVVAAGAAAWWRGGRGGWSLPCVVGGFTLVYVATLFVSGIAPLVELGILPRFFVPLYAPLLVLALAALDRLPRSGKSLPAPPRFVAAFVPPGWSAPALVAAAALSLWLAVHAPLTVRGIAQFNEDGFYVAGPRARPSNSETLRFVLREGLNGEALVLNSDPGPLHLYADIATEANRELPLAGADMRERIARTEDGVPVVWFHRGQRRRDYGSLDLRATPRLELVAELDDGLVFRIDHGGADGRAEDWRRAFAAAASGEPAAVAGGFALHLDGKRLHYAGEPCGWAETAAPFFLHVFPANDDDLPSEHRWRGYDRRDFRFRERGARLGGRCLATAPLPDYPIARIRTGQVRDGDRLWTAEFPGDAARGP